MEILRRGLKTLNKLDTTEEAERLAAKTLVVTRLLLSSGSGPSLLVEPNVFPIDFNPSDPV